MSQPFVVSVLGLKKCGKTTVVEGLVAELRRRGYAVGTVKSMVHSAFSFDVRGKDTCRHGEAGAGFVISLSRDQMVYLERRSYREKDLSELERFFPSGTQFVVCEGFEGRGSDCQVLALREPGDLEETVRIRSADHGKVIAVSGLVASRERTVGEHRTFDIMDGSDRGSLTDLVLDRAGWPEPTGEPGGPLVEDPEWLPGELPPGEFPPTPHPRHGSGCT